jgi:hypothetical protein
LAVIGSVVVFVLPSYTQNGFLFNINVLLTKNSILEASLPSSPAPAREQQPADLLVSSALIRASRLLRCRASTHNMMIRQLNALEVLFRGGQRAVDEFMSSTLTDMEKLKLVAISKAKRGADGNGGPPRKRNRLGGGGGGGGGGPGGGSGGPGGGGGGGGQSYAFGGSSAGRGGQNNGPRPGMKCKKMESFRPQDSELFSQQRFVMYAIG